jgi:membrane associated rhomboid family serine protease
MLGYQSAPVTQLMSLLILSMSIFLKSFHEGWSFELEAINKGNLHRLVTSQLVFTSVAQTMVGLSLLYVCRQFERQLGSRKFGAFTFLSFTLSALLAVAMASATKAMDYHYSPSSGPYTFIFSLLVLYYTYVPKLQPSKYVLLGLPLSEKTWTYVFGAQLFFNERENSVGPSILGILIGMIYLGNYFNMQAWRLPGFIEKIFAAFGSVFSFMMPAPPSNATRAAPGGAGGDGAEFDRARIPSWTDATRERLDSFGGMGPAIAPPSEDQITQLTALGFERSRAVHALEQCENNVEAAANFLLR